MALFLCVLFAIGHAPIKWRLDGNDQWIYVPYIYIYVYMLAPPKKTFSMIADVLFNSGKSANWKYIVPCFYSKSTKKINIQNGDSSMNKTFTGFKHLQVYSK